jgi:hypothetical protein
MRFKTEEELIKEFGEDFRDKLPWTWSNSKDHLFGQHIPNKFYLEMLANGKSRLRSQTDTIRGSWTITPELITED